MTPAAALSTKKVRAPERTEHPVETSCCYCGTKFGTPAELGKHLVDGHTGVPVSPGPSFPDDRTLLSADQERTLSEAVRRTGPGAEDARRVFVERNQGLVGSIAKQYLNWGVPLADLVQEGNLGLLRAIEKFDPGRGTRFSTYATWWIAQAIRKSLVEGARLVRVPVHMLDLAAKARRTMRDDPGLDIEGAAGVMGVSPEKVAEALGVSGARSVSMESGDRDGDGRHTLGSLLSSPEEETPALGPDERERLLEGLTPRHRLVLVRRFGLDGKPPVHLEALGRELRLTRERIRQIEAQALAYLKRHRVKEGPDGEPTLDLSAAAAPLKARPPKTNVDMPDPNPAPRPPAERKTPLPHQEEALSAILPELEARGRATAVMACGTGKTLVGAWAFERSGARTGLILGPSLSILRQTLKEWLAHGVADRYLCVCGDATVSDGGELRTSAYELGIPVTTDAEEVRRTLSADAGRTAVVCTYHSARVLGRGLPPGFRFDLAVFDEAHRTAGGRDRDFSFGLLDTQIGARRRLFMTATPRGVAPDGSDEGPFSMDDERVYGRKVYELGLSEAIERGIVCDYRIVVAVITQDDVAHALRGQPGILAKGVAAARRSALSVAFARAAQECGAAKIITFHESVAAAERFAESRWLREELLPEGFQTFHVNGMMPAADRHAVLRRFESAGASVVTNARCLNEGIDVPAVDMVAFMAPKRSQVDIVQAIGRVLRKAPGKTVGYVMLPILVDEKGDPISTTEECRDLSRVLQGLRSQDGDLDRRIRREAFDRGSGHRRGPGAFEDRVVVAGALPDEVRGAITTRILNPLGTSWDEMFGRLVAFRRSHGDREPGRSEAGKALMDWISEQRSARRRESLSPRQIELLDSVKFSWNPRREAWPAMVAKLRAWKEQHGDLDVPGDRRKLYGFVGNCRRLKRNGELSPERIAELEAMGFEWREELYEHVDDRWARQYRAVRKLYLEGDRELRRADEKLRLWATVQRCRLKNGVLDPRREKLLRAIGFKWAVSQRRLLRPREFSREKAPIGTIRVRRTHENGRDVEVRYVKVSDTGPEQKRWKAYARWWWEKNRGPVPAGKGVLHRNGDTMDDSPENLMLGTAADRIRLAHLNDPEMSKRNMRTVHEGCARWNREQGKRFRFENIVKGSWYPAIPALGVVLNVSFRKRIGVFRAFGVDVSRIPKSGHGPEVERASEASGIRPVSSAEMLAEPYAGYARVDVDLGLANPEKAGPDAKDRMRSVMESPYWRHAKAAAALDVHERC